jgi:hypothetical protein
VITPLKRLSICVSIASLAYGVGQVNVPAVARSEPGPQQGKVGAAQKRPAADQPVAATAHAIEDVFVPSGMMGDAERPGPLTLDAASRERPHSGPTCYKLVYRPAGKGWAAVAWQYPENNWGDLQGKDLAGLGITALSLWARGVPDGEGRYPTVQFKAGGNTSSARRHKASFAVEGEFVTLTGEWTEFTLNLRGKDLSNILSAFTVVIRAQDHGAGGATFFLDAIAYR